jgi:hypothetical protein
MLRTIRISTATASGLALLITLLLAPMTYGQPAQTASAQPAVASRGPDYVEEKGFKGKIFEIKYRDPMGLIRVIQPLGSGFKGATMSYNQEFRTLTVRDFPENIAAIEEAIKRLDVAEAPRPDIEFHVHVLIASDTPAASDEVPAELSDVIRQMKSTLKYKSYTLMTSAIQRTKEGLGKVENNGVVESKLFSLEKPQGSPIFYSYVLLQPSLDTRTSGGPTIQMNEFRFSMRIPLTLGTSNIQYENVGFQTPVSLRDGEKVIVGTTTMGDKGLVVVVSAKVLK